MHRIIDTYSLIETHRAGQDMLQMRMLVNMIYGQKSHPAVPQPVNPGVADMDGMRLAAPQDQCGKGGPHILQFRIVARLPENANYIFNLSEAINS